MPEQDPRGSPWDLESGARPELRHGLGAAPGMSPARGDGKEPSPRRGEVATDGVWAALSPWDQADPPGAHGAGHFTPWCRRGSSSLPLMSPPGTMFPFQSPRNL